MVPAPLFGRRIPMQRLLQIGLCSAASATLFLAAVVATQDAAADGDTRSLSFFHTHRRDSATITFRRNGRYDEQALAQLNWYLRDWRTDEPAKMDPRLFDVLWEVYQESGSREPINIISAYRSPQTNAMLRNRSSGVSEHSQHMLGKAMDIRLPDVETGRLRAIAMKLQYGGVGYYASSEFVHVDTGNVRAWPRMTQDQLARLFPNGKTLHLPTNGRPLPGYEEAKAEILPRNAALAAQATSGGSLGSIMTALFKRKEPPPAPVETQTSDPAISASPPGVPATALALVPVPPQRPKDLIAVASVEPPMPPRPERPIVTAALTTPSRSIEPILGVNRTAAVKALFDPRTAFLDLGFSPELKSELTTTSFTGPAVKPLPVKSPAPVRQASAALNTGS
ncbi:DUF882 domain-containing protein [Microvirga rosea]|uniref:DUF882 domain-containing protein n=1 Tax=Microvirga rosea TaxID=2715425 RepID=UPI001D0A9F5E|nr:DUF882 domain-containing protein [Microvirga rosea]MCB8823261.1 DUF882 domain-containing protein [Microvirga rosea]